mmetsp:Transcript_111384/g.325825  ORF Transcript_111384/g.325825 Transcript_111384/m.325825 type:complete len:255 (-) Transcript_111384:202-966(-)
MGLDESEKLFLLAHVAERAERWDEMADYMKALAELGSPLNSDQRNMLSSAFKSALAERRQALRVAVAAAQEYAADHAQHASLAIGYKNKVEAELKEICEKATALLSSRLVPSAAPGEAKTFYLKMLGDYYRYLAEFAEGDARLRAAEEAKGAYAQGMQEATALSEVDPVRLGLALNFSVFYYEVYGSPQKACQLAKSAFEQAMADKGDLKDDQFKDREQILQLLRDNLTLWTSDAQAHDGGKPPEQDGTNVEDL